MMRSGTAGIVTRTPSSSVSVTGNSADPAGEGDDTGVRTALLPAHADADAITITSTGIHREARRDRRRCMPSIACSFRSRPPPETKGAPGSRRRLSPSGRRPPPFARRARPNRLGVGLLTSGWGSLVASAALPRTFPGLAAQWHHSGSLPGHSGATAPVSHRLPSWGLSGVPPRLGHPEARYSIAPDSSQTGPSALAPVHPLPLHSRLRAHALAVRCLSTDRGGHVARRVHGPPGHCCNARHPPRVLRSPASSQSLAASARGPGGGGRGADPGGLGRTAHLRGPLSAGGVHGLSPAVEVGARRRGG